MKENKSINTNQPADVKLIPQALDVNHPLHEEFWQMVVVGSIALSEEELNELLSSFKTQTE